jgi:hypothetical protein
MYALELVCIALVWLEVIGKVELLLLFLELLFYHICKRSLKRGTSTKPHTCNTIKLYVQPCHDKSTHYSHSSHKNTRWFKYDRDYLCVNKSQFVPVIFEPPCNITNYKPSPCATHTPNTHPSMPWGIIDGLLSMRTVLNRHSNLSDMLWSSTISGTCSSSDVALSTVSYKMSYKS